MSVESSHSGNILISKTFRFGGVNILRNIQSEERGFGIATSRRILVEGLRGTFVYLSGNGLLINEELTNFGTNFNGSIVLIRIPVGTFKKEFDWSRYVE